jgi:hypothetical protein
MYRQTYQERLHSPLPPPTIRLSAQPAPLPRPLESSMSAKAQQFESMAPARASWTRRGSLVSTSCSRHPPPVVALHSHSEKRPAPCHRTRRGRSLWQPLLSVGMPRSHAAAAELRHWCRRHWCYIQATRSGHPHLPHTGGIPALPHLTPSQSAPISTRRWCLEAHLQRTCQ